jgi:hypothetical protein
LALGNRRAGILREAFDHRIDTFAASVVTRRRTPKEYVPVGRLSRVSSGARLS